MTRESYLRLIENCYELVPIKDIGEVPSDARGVYVLYDEKRPRRPSRSPHWDVVYVGLAAGAQSGIKGRLMSHKRTKPDEWTHFSAFAVWPNIRDDEIAELEGLFRHIYRFDTHANRLNIHRGYAALDKVRAESKRAGWMKRAHSEVPRRGSGT